MAEDKKPVPKRKFNPDNIPPIGDDNQQKNKNRFNIYWVYGLVFAGILVYNFTRTFTTAGVETNQIKFTELVKQGDIESIKTILIDQYKELLEVNQLLKTDVELEQPSLRFSKNVMEPRLKIIITRVIFDTILQIITRAPKI